MQRVAHLLGVPVQSLIDALTRKTIFAHGETVVSKELFALRSDPGDDKCKISLLIR